MRTALLIVLFITWFTIDSAGGGADTIASPAVGVTTNENGKLTITTTKGVTYENCKIKRAEPDGLTVFYSKGIAKIPFPELPPELAQRHGYDPKKAYEYAREAAKRRAAAAARTKSSSRQSSSGGKIDYANYKPRTAAGKAAYKRVTGEGARKGIWNLSSAEKRQFYIRRGKAAYQADGGSGSSRSSSSSGAQWQAVVNLNGIPVVLGTSSSYDGANRILHQKGYAGQGYIKRKR